MRHSCLILLICLAVAPGLVAELIVELRPEVANELERAIALEQRGEVREAERLLLNLMRTAGDSGRDGFEVAIVSNNLAVLYAAIDRFDDAELHFIRAVRILEKLPGDEVAQISAKARLHLISLYLEAGKRSQAIKLKPQELLDRLREPDDQNRARGTLAALAMSQNDLDTAEQMYTQVLGFWREPGRAAGYQGELASTLNNLGVIALRKGRMELARTRLEESLGVWQALFGPKSPNLAKAMSNIGMVCARLKQYEDAVKWLGPATEIAQGSFGESHPFTIAIQFAHAEALKKSGRKPEAKEIFKSAVAARKMMRNPSTSIYTVSYRDLMTGPGAGR